MWLAVAKVGELPPPPLRTSVRLSRCAQDEIHATSVLFFVFCFVLSEAAVHATGIGVRT